MSRIQYGIDRVIPDDLPPVVLKNNDRVDLRTALSQEPTAKFQKSILMAVAGYRWYRAEVKNSMPGQLTAIFARLREDATCLRHQIENLNQTAEDLYTMEGFTPPWLRKESCISLRALERHLAAFISGVIATETVLKPIPKRGAMPTFADQCFAIDLENILRVELRPLEPKWRPPLTTGKTFDKVLCWGLDFANSDLGVKGHGKERSNVKALMSHARKRGLKIAIDVWATSKPKPRASPL